MANKENNANAYREERKKRLAKNAKKSSKKSFDSVAATTVVIKALIAVALVAFLGFALMQFGVPHKFLPAVKVGDRTYTAAEYSFFYSSVFNTYAEQSSQLSQSYGYTLFDYTKDPALQTTTDEDGNTITYDELFKKNAIKNIETSNYYLEKCEAENIQLSHEHEEEIAELMSQLKTTAESNNVSVSRYITLAYGKGLSVKSFEKLLKEQYLVAQYVENIEAECYDTLSDEELEAAYAADPSDYESVDLRLFGFEIADYETEKAETTTNAAETTTTTAEETTVATEATTEAEETTAATEAEAETSAEETTAAETTTEAAPKEPGKTEQLANEMLSKITDEASFIKLAQEYAAEDEKATFANDTATLAKSIKKSAVASNIGEELAEWLYSSERAVGDKRVYVADKYVYVIYILKTTYRNDEPLVDARHILVSFDSVAAELSKTEGNTIDVTKKDDVETKTGTTEDGAVISNEGTGYSTELVLETYKKAADIRDKYLSGEKTEDAFAALAEEFSEDTGSVGENGSGGLYAGIERGKMVKPFEDWVYDSNRQAGETGIVVTEYGCHVMYFVKQHEEPAWKNDVRNTLGAKAFEEKEAELTESVEGTATEATFYSFATNEAYKNHVR